MVFNMEQILTKQYIDQRMKFMNEGKHYEYENMSVQKIPEAL